MENLQVVIGGWENPRLLIRKNGQIYFEVALDHNHCPTCASRFRKIEEALNSQNIGYAWLHPAGSLALVTIKDRSACATADETFIKYVNGVFQLTITSWKFVNL